MSGTIYDGHGQLKQKEMVITSFPTSIMCRSPRAVPRMSAIVQILIGIRAARFQRG